jgi:uncharacterized protein (DUF58 family)
MASAMEDDVVTLDRRSIYILPTRAGIVFTGLLFVLLVAAINYSNGLAYGLTFLLAAVALVALLYTHRNLHRVRISAGSAPPVFAGEVASFEVCLSNSGQTPRVALRVEQEEARSGARPPWRMAGRMQVARVHLGDGETTCVTVSLPTLRRGYLHAPAISLSTEFPLGIAHAWSRRVMLPTRILVYPRPAPPRPRLAAYGGGEQAGTAAARGGDDFAGLREYARGDSLRHVHWKAVARGQGWLTKEFGGGSLGVQWLDWDALEGLEVEVRLSVLTRWVLDAEQVGELYGLRLPGKIVEPGSGEAHRDCCLIALALFGES